MSKLHLFVPRIRSWELKWTKLRTSSITRFADLTSFVRVRDSQGHWREQHLPIQELKILYHPIGEMECHQLKLGTSQTMVHLQRDRVQFLRILHIHLPTEELVWTLTHQTEGLRANNKLSRQVWRSYVHSNPQVWNQMLQIHQRSQIQAKTDFTHQVEDREKLRTISTEAKLASKSQMELTE